MQLFLHNLKIALRNISGSKLRFVICILGLSAGILSFTLCTYIPRLFLNMNSLIPNAERIMNLQIINENGTISYLFNLTEIEQIKKLPGIETIAIFSGSEYNTSSTQFQIAEDKYIPYLIHSFTINDGFPEVYSMKLLAGHKKEIFSTPYSVLISQSLAKKVYDKESPLGKIIKSQGKDYIIRGIIEDMPQPSPFPSQALFFCISDVDPNTHLYKVKLLLQLSYSENELKKYIEEQQFKIFVHGRENPEEISEWTPHVYHNEKLSTGEAIVTFAIFGGVGLMVLLAGLSNFLILSFGNFYNQTKNLVLRKSLGASPKDLLYQLLTEISLILISGTLLSLVLTEISLTFINSWITTTLKTHIYIGSWEIVVHQIQYLAGIWMVCGFLCIIAIYRLNRMSFMKGFKIRDQKKTSHPFRNSMLAFQFLIGFLFIGAGLMIDRQLKTLEQKSFPSFPLKEQLATLRVDLTLEEVKEVKWEIINRFQSYEYIAEILYTDTPDILLYRSIPYFSGDDEISVYFLSAGPDFSGFINLPVLSGSGKTDEQGVIISKRLWEKLEEKEHSGNLILRGSSLPVTGVIEDFDPPIIHEWNREFFVISPVDDPSYCFVKSIPGKEKETHRYVEQTLREWIPESLPLEFSDFYEANNPLCFLFRIVRHGFFFFGFVTILINLLSIYSAISLDTSKREKEIAIRKVNGAIPKQIYLLFGKLYLTLFILAMAVAIPVLLLIEHQIFIGFAARYNFYNPLFWILFIMINFFFIAGVIGYRLYRAGRLNPADVMKNE